MLFRSLDIEALLSEAETPLDSSENLSFESFSGDDDLSEMMDIEIPKQPEEELAESTDTYLDLGSELEITSDDLGDDDLGDSDILDLSEIINEHKPTDVSEAEMSGDDMFGDDEDSLFGQLEGMLAETPAEDMSPQVFDESNSELETKIETPQASQSKDEVEELDNILAEAMQDPASLEAAPNAPKDMLESAEIGKKPAFHSDDDDMDMVKSLMADLTEPEESINEESINEDITGHDAQGGEDLDNTDILDEIMNMSLEDELGEEEAELKIPEPDGPQEDIDSSPEALQEVPDEIIENDISLEDLGFDALEADATAADDKEAFIEESRQSEITVPEKQPSLAAQSLISSLREIAGEAERDALEAEAKFEAAQGAGEKDNQTSENTQTTAGGNFPSEAAEQNHEDVPASADVVHIAPDRTQKETADMPKAAVNQDRILDDVSGEAASSAFASLNNMVEEKALKAERGDRIGDLVMEALRPMLKEWLDEHLNDIVERAVTKEVQRISSGK